MKVKIEDLYSSIIIIIKDSHRPTINIICICINYNDYNKDSKKLCNGNHKFMMIKWNINFGLEIRWSTYSKKKKKMNNFLNKTIVSYIIFSF